MAVDSALNSPRCKKTWITGVLSRKRPTAAGTVSQITARSAALSVLRSAPICPWAA